MSRSMRRDLVGHLLQRATGSRVLFRAPARGRSLCLTFDDGPHAENTPEILDVLAHYGARATFFPVGTCAANHPELVARLVREGHAVGSHTENHVDLSKAPSAQVEREIAESLKSIGSAAGVRVEAVRPPWGRFRWSTLRTAARHGLRIVMWSLDSLDHRMKDADALTARMREVPLAPGEIVLFHDDYDHTVRALPALLENLSKAGWDCATVPELLARGG